MAHNVTRAYQVAAQPWVVETVDTDLHAFLLSLNGAGASDLGTTEETLALWAVQVPSSDESDGGTAYVVSAETYKRVQAGRY